MRYQILFPMTLVMLVSLVAVSMLNAYFSAQKAKAHINQQLQSVAGTVSNSNFPLNSAVLNQLKGLSGAEVIVTDLDGNSIVSTRKDLSPPLSPENQHEESFELGNKIKINNESFFYATLKLANQPTRRNARILHLLYPEQSYRTALRNAIISPLLVGGIALVLMIILSIWISSRVTKPLAELRNQVENIAQGEFHSMNLPKRDDEIRDLGVSFNLMTEMLAVYEEEIRRNERLKTLGQLSGSMAHQLRNAATGCRMALELHSRNHPEDSDAETFNVAMRQLTLIEQYLKQFFSRRNGDITVHQEVNLKSVIEDVLIAVKPNASHAGVQLNFICPESPVIVRGNREGLEQMILNLVQNAVEAATVDKVSRNDPDHHGKVSVRISTARNGQIQLEVTDSGIGPDQELKDSMFEPLITGKIDGTGLGLSVAQEIARQHDSQIHWERIDHETRFQVEFPSGHSERSHVKLADC